MTGTLFTFLYVFNFTTQRDINPFHFFTCLHNLSSFHCSYRGSHQGYWRVAGSELSELWIAWNLDTFPLLVSLKCLCSAGWRWFRFVGMNIFVVVALQQGCEMYFILWATYYWLWSLVGWTSETTWLQYGWQIGGEGVFINRKSVKL